MVLFHPLSGEQLRKIARMQQKGLAARLADKGIGLDVTDAAMDVVVGIEPSISLTLTPDGGRR